jgi:Uma2 family endonuclease
MAAIIIEGDVIIPEGLHTLVAFRRWCDSAEFPEEGRIDFLQGEVWVDMSWEQIFSHNQVKQEYNQVVGGLAKVEKRGRWFPDGARWSNIDVDISIVPDGMFISVESMRDANIKFIEGAREGYIEIEGIIDMALEIVSESSVKKDATRLPKVYWEARVKEYWLVDVRRNRLDFRIYRHAKKGYIAVRKDDGWMKSQVFGKSFRLSRGEDEFGQPEFTLEVR